MAEDSERRVLIARMETLDGAPIILLGFSQASIDFLTEEPDRMHHMDLSPAGVKAKVVVIHGKDRADLMKQIDKVSLAASDRPAARHPGYGVQPIKGIDDQG